jgi:pimeloyl-ACP methyl ester carboxylesterase
MFDNCRRRHRDLLDTLRVVGPDRSEVPRSDIEALRRAFGVPRRRRESRVARGLAGIPCERIPFVDGTVAAWRGGTGPAVLLAHGWEDDNSLWEPLIDELLRRELAFVVLDMPAHGASDGEWGLNPQAIDALHAVAGALGPVDAVVAHSFSAGAVGAAIAEGLHATRLALIAPPLGSGNRWLRYAERLGLSEVVAEVAKAEYEAEVGPERSAFWLREALPHLGVELLIVHSVDDERMRYSDSEALVAACPGATLVAVKELSHRRTARDPEVVIRLADWLASRTGE